MTIGWLLMMTEIILCHSTGSSLWTATAVMIDVRRQTGGQLFWWSSSSVAPLRRRTLRKHDVAAEISRPSNSMISGLAICGVDRHVARRRSSTPRSAGRPRGLSGGRRAGLADEDRTDDVLKRMFLRLRDVDTSLCFTAAAAVTEVRWWVHAEKCMV